MVDQDPAQALVERAKDGDRQAFDELVVTCRNRLRSSIRGWSKFHLGPKLDLDEVLPRDFPRDGGYGGDVFISADWCLGLPTELNGRLYFWGDDGVNGTRIYTLPIYWDVERTLFHRGDPNLSGKTDISDAIYLLNWLFTGGPAPAAPGPTGSPCGLDPDPRASRGDLGCEVYAACN